MAPPAMAIMYNVEPTFSVPAMPAAMSAMPGVTNAMLVPQAMTSPMAVSSAPAMVGWPPAHLAMPTDAMPTGAMPGAVFPPLPTEPAHSMPPGSTSGSAQAMPAGGCAEPTGDS